jgi:large subunit ribosomal protein L4
MANAVSYSKTGTKHDAAVKLEASVFGVEANHELVGQAYRTYLSNGRSAHAVTLKRGEVAGGGKKPWRQKGTGRARVGSIRVPNWRGGGVVFGPTGNQNYTISLPVRMKRLAIRHALSLQAEASQISVIEAFTSTDGRVKPTVELLTKLGLSGSVVVVVASKSDLLERATRNIQGLQLVSAKYLNVYTIMNADHLVFTTEAVETVNEWLGDKS